MAEVAKQMPIGYWLKRVDNLLMEKINQVQAANGVSRFEMTIPIPRSGCAYAKDRPAAGRCHRAVLRR